MSAFTGKQTLHLPYAPDMPTRCAKENCRGRDGGEIRKKKISPTAKNVNGKKVENTQTDPPYNRPRPKQHMEGGKRTERKEEVVFPRNYKGEYENVHPSNLIAWPDHRARVQKV